MGQTGSGAGVGELAPFEQRVAAVVGDRLLLGVVPPAEGDSDLAQDPTEGTIILIYLTNFLIPASRA